MRKVLFVTPTLRPSGAARRLSLLAGPLAREFDLCVAVLGADSPWAQGLRAAGVSVEVLRWTRLLDARPFLQLRSLLASFAPDVVHAWGLPALRALTLSLARSPSRLVVSQTVRPFRQRLLLDDWLLRRAGRVAAFGPADGARYHSLGVPAGRITTWPHAVAPHVPAPTPPVLPDLPPGARVIVVLGPMELDKGFKEAVWAVDIVRYVHEDVHLVLVGSGAQEARVHAFARGIQVLDRVHFVGEVDDVAGWLETASVVWVPARRDAGVCAALEAMAAGKPVVASALPGLAEVVVPGETGFLVRPGDKAELARQTHAILRDETQRRRMGEAARARAALFPVEALVRAAAELYVSG